MANQQIVEYIKGQLALGADPKALHFKLVSEGGWNPKDIDEAFSIASPTIPISNISKRPIKKMKIVLIILGVFAMFIILALSTIYYLDGGFVNSSYRSRESTQDAYAQNIIDELMVKLDNYYDQNGVYPVSQDCSSSGIFAEKHISEFSSAIDLKCRVYTDSYAVSVQLEDYSKPLCIDSRGTYKEFVNIADTGTEAFCNSITNQNRNARKIEESVENDYPNIPENSTSSVLNGAEITAEDMVALKIELANIEYSLVNPIPSATDCSSGIFARSLILKEKGQDMACFSYPDSYAVITYVKSYSGPYCIDSNGFQGSGAFLFEPGGGVSCQFLE